MFCNNNLGDFQEIIYPQAQDFCSFSWRKMGRIASYATLFTTRKRDKKTSLWVNYSPEIALVCLPYTQNNIITYIQLISANFRRIFP